ncbi:MAG TPA: hypothetical protein VFZ54_04400 [Burkholderiales bacterium]
MHKDIRQVREHYAAIRDLIAQQLGGRDDVATRAQVSVLCEAAIATLDDGECRQRLRAVDRHAAELFSDDQHQKWDREHMSGSAYLRLQILIALEAVNTRLFFLEALRDRAPQQAGGALRPPAV